MKIDGTFNFITVEGAQGEVSANFPRGMSSCAAAAARSSPSRSKERSRWKTRADV